MECGPKKGCAVPLCWGRVRRAHVTHHGSCFIDPTCNACARKGEQKESRGTCSACAGSSVPDKWLDAIACKEVHELPIG